MKAFCEKSDLVLRTLNSATSLNWDLFTQLTKTIKTDGVLIFLKEKGFIVFTEKEIRLTAKGGEFISNTSFAEQRDLRQPGFFTSKLMRLPEESSK